MNPSSFTVHEPRKIKDVLKTSECRHCVIFKCLAVDPEG